MQLGFAADGARSYVGFTEQVLIYPYSGPPNRPVVPAGAGAALAPPGFGRIVNPISTKGDRLYPPNNTGTPGFPDFPTALTLT